MCLFPHTIKGELGEPMSHTTRREPMNPTGLRHPHTVQEIRQLTGLHTDALIEGYTISPINRINRHIPSSWDDLKPSSTAQLHTT